MTGFTPSWETMSHATSLEAREKLIASEVREDDKKYVNQSFEILLTWAISQVSEEM